MPPLVQQEYQSPHQSTVLGATCIRQVQLQKLARRVEETVRKITHRDAMAPLTAETWAVWRNVCISGQSLLPAWGCWDFRDIPQLNALHHIGAAVRQLAVEEQMTQRHHRRAAWTEWFSRDWRQSRKQAFDFVKGAREGATPLLETPTGELTGDPVVIDQLLRDSWLPIFRMYSPDNPPPSWADFEAHYRPHLPEGLQQPYAPLTVEQLRQTLRRMRTSTAVGVDGWRVDELRLLPDSMLSRLCDFFARVEREGEWPGCLATGLVTMLSKGEGAMPTDLRPIHSDQCPVQTLVSEQGTGGSPVAGVLGGAFLVWF